MEILKLTLLENAHDFMKSAVEEAEKDDKRYWKYAILNLSIGLELLIKARLEQEDWSLLFEKVDEASQKKMESGDF